MTEKQPPSSRGPKIVLSLVTLLMGWGIIEIAFRILCPTMGIVPPPVPEKNRIPWIAYDPTVGWVNKPGHEGRQVKSNQFDVAITIDSQGCRRAGPPPADPVLRLLVLGDSFTFGHGVNDGETFSAYLERLMEKSLVLNAGCVGTGHDQHYLLFKKWEQMGGVKPDLVIWGFSSADIPRNTVPFRRLVDTETGLDYGKPLFVLKKGKLELTNVPTPEPAQVEPALQAWWAERERSHTFVGRFFRRSRAIRVAWDMAGDKLRQMPLARAIGGEFVEECRRQNVPLVIVNLPTRRWLNTRNPINRMKSRMSDSLLRELADKHNARVIDCTPGFLAQSDLDALFIKDGHYSPAGHAVVAEVIAEALSKDAKP